MELGHTDVAVNKIFFLEGPPFPLASFDRVEDVIPGKRIFFFFSIIARLQAIRGEF